MKKEGLLFVVKNKWEYKEVTDNQCCVKTCPLCSNDNWKFYIEKDTALWDCKVCGEAGNLYQLKGKLYGSIGEIESMETMFKNKKPIDNEILIEFEKNLNENKEANDYLIKTRCFTSEIIKKFRLGLRDTEWIVIPHIQEGIIWNMKMRNFKEKKFHRITGQPSILFNLDNVDLTKPALVIVESETDCIAATQLGVTNVIGLTTGAQSFPAEWVPYTLKFKDIIICLNSDQPGQTGARKIAEKLGMSKCRNVLLPTKDVNDYLIEGHTKKEFKTLLKNSKIFEINNVKKIDEYVKDIDQWLNKEGSIDGLSLPFKKINNVLKGFKGEDLIVVSGDTGVGKTTISLNILHNFIKKGHKCLGFFLEGKIMFYIMRMMSIENQIEYEKLNEHADWEKIKTNFSDYPMFFYSGSQFDLTTEKLKEILVAAVKLYDIEYVMIDHIGKFVKDNKYATQEASRAVSDLKAIAIDLNIPILLITHIHNIEKGRKRIMMSDAKTTSTLRQEADIYLTVWNNKNEKDIDDDMILTIEKNRMGEDGIDTKMVFEKQFGIYRERIEGIDVRKSIPKKIKEISSEDFDIIDESF